MALLQFDARPFRRILPPPDGAPSHPPPGGQVNGTLVQDTVTAGSRFRSQWDAWVRQAGL